MADKVGEAKQASKANSMTESEPFRLGLPEQLPNQRRGVRDLITSTYQSFINHCRYPLPSNSCRKQIRSPSLMFLPRTMQTRGFADRDLPSLRLTSNYVSVNRGAPTW